jgi:hypothetical protein
MLHIHIEKFEKDKQTKTLFIEELEHQLYIQCMLPFSHLGRGKHFGELALSMDNKHNVRAASVSCLSNCIFATLKKTDY